MNDSFSGKNGKVKVMYVRSDESSDDRNSSNRDNRNNSSRDNSNRDNNSRGRSQRPAGNGRPGDNARQGDNTRQGNAPRNNDSRRPDSGRNERDRPSRPARSEGSSPYDSPWKTVSRAPSEEPEFDHGGISVKAISILPSCAVSALKKHAFMVRMLVRRCLKAALMLSSGLGLCNL
ncbi:putative tRNA/rRNA methyltransferase [Yersinia pestis D182038]|nr:putative tRNA/rRNA methyltransferase [Yersinia pestis D182038]